MAVEKYLPRDRNGRLFHVVEECGEVMQMIGKAVRFGMQSSNPLIEGSPTNARLLRAELLDLRCAIDALLPDLDL
jgi:hypothetical protein